MAETTSHTDVDLLHSNLSHLDKYHTVIINIVMAYICPEKDINLVQFQIWLVAA